MSAFDPKSYSAAPTDLRDFKNIRDKSLESFYRHPSQGLTILELKSLKSGEGTQAVTFLDCKETLSKTSCRFLEADSRCQACQYSNSFSVLVLQAIFLSEFQTSTKHAFLLV